MAIRTRSVAQRKSGNSLAERAYQVIREKILRGEYRLGAALSRRKIADEIGMSFLPVSEALQRLEIDGMVESKPRVGTRVRVPSQQDIRERFMLREALETQAAREFAEHASDQARIELATMGRHVDSLYQCCEGADEDFLYSVHSYHLNFHLRIAEASNCGLLRKAIEREQVLVFNWLFDTAAQRRSLPPNFHADLAGALADGDVAEADRCMRAHIRFGLADVLQIVEPRQDVSAWRLPRNQSA